jgi:hypothetical protein
VARHSLSAAIGSAAPLRYLKRSARMMWYGRWLKREARTGRFHYLPAETITEKLTHAGFAQITHRMSYCDQAYIFRAVKPA